MGIAYVVVGGICVLLGTLFAIAHLVRPRYGPFFDPYAFFFFFLLGEYSYYPGNLVTIHT